MKMLPWKTIEAKETNFIPQIYIHKILDVRKMAYEFEYSIS